MTQTTAQTIAAGQTGDLYSEFARGWTYRHNGIALDCLSTMDGRYVAPKGELTLILRGGQPAVSPDGVAGVDPKDVAIAVRVCTLLSKRYT